MSPGIPLRVLVALTLLASLGLAVAAVSSCLDDDCAPTCGDCTLCAPIGTLASSQVDLSAPAVEADGPELPVAASMPPPRGVEHVPLAVA